jgi:hypothetical protein
MNMVLALEKEFDLRFGLEEIEHLVSIRHIVERVDEKLNPVKTDEGPQLSSPRDQVG